MDIAMLAQMMRLWTVGTRIACLLAVTVPCVALAGQIVVPPVPAPEFADTEVATNIAVRIDDERVGEIEMHFALSDGALSNCVQVAFGRDADGDGSLGFDETETLFGWRRGRFFAEGARDGVRVEDAAAGGDGARAFAVSLRLARGRGLKVFSAADSAGFAVLTNLPASAQGWLYGPGWDMMRVTRRGPGVQAEWFSCDIRSQTFSVRLK